jgi:hypothetical protein
MRDEDKQPWDRLTGESSKAFANFCLYRDMGVSRSLRKAAVDGRCTAKLRQLERWSTRHKWVERAADYDAYLDRLARFESERARKNMLKRHSQLSLLGQNVAVASLQRILHEMNEDPACKLTPRDAGYLLDLSVKIERVARGEPESSVELSGSAARPLNVQLVAQKAIEQALGIYGPAADRIEPETDEPTEEQPGNPGTIDPFADLPPAEEPDR